MKLPPDTRYGNATYLNFSTLASVIEYDMFGTRHFNPLAVYKPRGKPTDSMQIGTIVDEHFTEGVNFYNEYTAVSQRSGSDPCELTNKMYDSINNVIEIINCIPYKIEGEKETLFVRHMEMKFDSQTCLSDDAMNLKGKMDFYSEEDNHIIDLKVPGSIEFFMKDLFIGKDRRVNINARYVRQLAWYSYLVEQNYGSYPTAELFAVDHSGEAILIDISEEARRAAWSVLLEDIKLLRENTDMRYQVKPMSADDLTDTGYSNENILDLL